MTHLGRTLACVDRIAPRGETVAPLAERGVCVCSAHRLGLGRGCCAHGHVARLAAEQTRRARRRTLGHRVCAPNGDNRQDKRSVAGHV